MPLVIQLIEASRAGGWRAYVELFRAMPAWAGILCLGVGISLLLLGSGKLLRLSGALWGALSGGLYVPFVVAGLAPDADPVLAVSSSIAILALLGGAYPPATLFIFFGLPAGLWAGGLAGREDWLLGFFPIFVGVGLVAVLAHRYASAVAAAMVGAWLATTGGLAALHGIDALVAAVRHRPGAVMIATLLFTIAGAIYQIAVAPPPDRSTKGALRQIERRKKAEQEELEARWAKGEREPP